METGLLRVEGVTKRIGGLVALDNVDLAIHEGEIVGLVGPNGAGKTTLLNVISGITRPTAGEVTFLGERITGRRPEQICHAGISKTFQHVHLFPGMTARECTMVAAIFGNSKGCDRAAGAEEAEKILDFVGFPQEKLDSDISHLNVVELKRVELARALASRPKLLLLDELTTGLTPTESRDAVELIRRICDSGTSILIIEHVMRVIMGVSQRIVVLDHGEKIAEGLPYEVVHNQRVIDTYLGEMDAF